jgi:hypothetical protein
VVRLLILADSTPRTATRRRALSGSPTAGVYTNIVAAASQLWLDVIRRLRTALTIGVVMSSTTCDRSLTPPSLPAARSRPTVRVPVPESANVSGTVWIHESEVLRPYAGGKVFGWIDTRESGCAL